jgi:hypothetical protein
MTGPCLCGDPACGRCFPQNQVRVHCVDYECGWHGRRYECGAEELSEGMVDLCPECGCGATEDE